MRSLHLPVDLFLLYTSACLHIRDVTFVTPQSTRFGADSLWISAQTFVSAQDDHMRQKVN